MPTLKSKEAKLIHPGKSSSSSQPVSSSSGSYSSSESKSTSSKTGSNKTGTGTGNVQEVDLEQSRPGIYKRIACIRYVRPMMPCMYDSWGCPMQMPYSGYGCYNSYGYAGEFPPSTRALIIPPKSKNLYRDARDEDYENNLKNVDVNASFLKIHVPDDPYAGTLKPPKKKILSPPPPPPPPKKKPPPKVDNSHLLKKFLHESHSKLQPKKKSEHHKEKVEEKKVEKKEENKVEPTKPEKPKEKKSVSAKASAVKKPSSSSSSSSDKTVSDVFVVTDAREHHFDTAVKRRGSSFDAVASHSYKVQTAAKEDPVAPMGFHNDTKNVYQNMPTNEPNATPIPNANNKETNVLYQKGVPAEPPLK